MSTKQRSSFVLNVKKPHKPGQKLVPVSYLMRNSSAEFLERLTGPSLSSTRHTHTQSFSMHTIRKNGSYAGHQTTYCLYMYGTFRFRSFILWCLKGGFFLFFWCECVCDQTQAVFFKMLQTSWTLEQRGLQLGGRRCFVCV